MAKSNQKILKGNGLSPSKNFCIMVSYGLINLFAIYLFISREIPECLETDSNEILRGYTCRGIFYSNDPVRILVLYR